MLSCSVLAARVAGRQVTTLEGVEAQADRFTRFLAAQGADQCGFCSPGLIMTVLAMARELTDPDEEQIRLYLSGNLCRCTGYAGQMRAIVQFLAARTKGGSTPCKS
jgi:carbon-monoxide dehydrogenase small subunit